MQIGAPKFCEKIYEAKKFHSGSSTVEGFGRIMELLQNRENPRKQHRVPSKQFHFRKSTAQLWLMAANFLCIVSLLVRSLARCCHLWWWCNLNPSVGSMRFWVICRLNSFIAPALSESFLEFSCRIKWDHVGLLFASKHLDPTLSVLIQITPENTILRRNSLRSIFL